MNTTDLTPLPAHPSLEQYKKQAKDLLQNFKSGDAGAIARRDKYHPRHGSFALADAQLVIAREHGFESWPKFTKHIRDITRPGSPTTQFELAAEAVINGDVEALTRALRENPELVRARSPRVHRATLLHYVSANGFENYRQKTPKNAVQIANILLDAGANVNAVADMYGSKAATLGLVATSAHPRREGVQIALLETLLERGALIEVGGAWSAVNSALANGSPEAAEFLAKRGAHLDFRAAAGLGRLELVKELFSSATREQRNTGFFWACEYGRNSVVEFLLDNGVDVTAQDRNGQTALHWAVIGGSVDTVRLLLARNAPLQVVNSYGGTLLGQARWCAAQTAAHADYGRVIDLLISAGAR